MSERVERATALLAVNECSLTTSDSDDEDETAALMAELAKIKQERAEEKARQVSPGVDNLSATRYIHQFTSTPSLHPLLLYVTSRLHDPLVISLPFPSLFLDRPPARTATNK